MLNELDELRALLFGEAPFERATGPEVHLLALLAPYLEDDQVGVALAMAGEIDDPLTIALFAATLPDGASAYNEGDSLYANAVRNIRDHWRPEARLGALMRIAASAPPSPLLLDSLVQAIRAVPFYGRPVTEQLLSILGAEQVRRIGLFTEALPPTDLPGTTVGGSLREALNSPLEPKARILERIASQLSLDQVLDAIRSLPPEEPDTPVGIAWTPRSWALRTLIPRLAELGLASEAFDLVRTMAAPPHFATALGNIAEYLSAPQLEEALRLASAITDSQGAAIAQAQIAASASGDLRADAVAGSLAAAARNRGSFLPDRLASLVRPFPVDLVDQLVDLTETLDPKLQPELHATAALLEISSQYGPAESATLLHRALSAARQIDQGFQRSIALAGVTYYGRKDQLTLYLSREVLAALASIPDDFARWMRLDPVVEVLLASGIEGSEIAPFIRESAAYIGRLPNWVDGAYAQQVRRLIGNVDVDEARELASGCVRSMKANKVYKPVLLEAEYLQRPPILPPTGASPMVWFQQWFPRGLGAGGPEPAVKPPEASRTVSTGFAVPNDPDTPIAGESILSPGQPLYFWVEIGLPVAGSIETEPTQLPISIPKHAVVTVVLFAIPGGFEIDPASAIGALQLTDGSAMVSRQPSPTNPSPRDTAPATRLLFPITTPKRNGVARLRCSMYYKRVLLQSRVIEAIVGGPSQQGRLSSTLDYDVASTLRPEHIGKLTPHRMSVMVNSTAIGTHQFSFFGDEEFTQSLSIDAETIHTLVETARSALREAAWGNSNAWDGSSPYRYRQKIDAKQFTDDLYKLAIVGHRLYWGLMPEAFSREQQDQLHRLMARPGLIQIALQKSARYIFPAGLIYDHELNSALPRSSVSLCSHFSAAAGSGMDLWQSTCFRIGCPNQSDQTIVCPSGFWGFRHSLGFPVTVRPGQDIVTEIAGSENISVVGGLATDLALIVGHEKALRNLRPNLTCQLARSREGTFDLLRSGTAQVVYFYCHGGVRDKYAFIRVGPREEVAITFDGLASEHIQWAGVRPLVFINGCQTAALDPDAVFNLVNAFVGIANAGGVIGTEITVFEDLAAPFAVEFLKAFTSQDRVPAGEAARRARLSLLADLNPLGLAYVAFAQAGLRLEWSQAFDLGPPPDPPMWKPKN